jgi:hypothetical protein
MNVSRFLIVNAIAIASIRTTSTAYDHIAFNTCLFFIYKA